jgi:hypothetical protein
VSDQTIKWYDVDCDDPADPHVWQGNIRGDLAAVAEQIAEQYDSDTAYEAQYPITLALIDVDGTEYRYTVERDYSPFYSAFAFTVAQ